MSLGIVIKGPEGLVLAADSRVTLTAQSRDGTTLPVNFDNATKLLSLSSEHHDYVGAVTYGAAVIGLRTAHSFMPEFETTLPGDRLTVEDYAHRMLKFFSAQFDEAFPDGYQGPPMMFIVGGYDVDQAYGRVFVFGVPNGPEPEERNPGDHNFGMTWGGQLQVASRLIHGYDPNLPEILKSQLNLDDSQLQQLLKVLESNLEFSIPYQVLPLQDCVDLAVMMIRTTVSAQNLSVGIRGVGGPTDLAVITRTQPIKYIQRKTLDI